MRDQSPDPFTQLTVQINGLLGQMQAIHRQDQATISALLPPDPPDNPLAATDFIYYVFPPSGSDSNAGTSIAPFATAQHAYQLAKANTAAGKSTTLVFACGFSAELWTDYLGNQVSIDGTWPGPVGAVAPASPLPAWAVGEINPSLLSKRAVLLVHSNTFVGNNVTHFHARGCIFLPFSGSSTANTEPFGFWANGGDDITFDRCLWDGFRCNVVLDNGVTRFRMYNCFTGWAFDPNLSTETCSGLFINGVAPDVQSTVFWHNGWRNPVANPSDPANAQEKQQMVFRHGDYNSNGAGTRAVAGIDKNCIYCRNACTGYQGRVGGHKNIGGIFWDNGNDKDIFVGAGFGNNLGGEIGNFAVFGNLTPDFYCWGGGVSGQSIADDIHDGLFSGDSRSMQVDAAITIQWTGGNGPAQIPLPANTTATVSNCRGYWPVQPAIVGLSGRTFAMNNCNVAALPVGKLAPALADYFGLTGTPQENEVAIAMQLQDPEPQQAQKIYAWLGSQLPR